MRVELTVTVEEMQVAVADYIRHKHGVIVAADQIELTYTDYGETVTGMRVELMPQQVKESYGDDS